MPTLALKVDPTHGFRQLDDRFERITWLTRIGFNLRLEVLLERMLRLVRELTPQNTGTTAQGWQKRVIGGGPKGRMGWIGIIENRLAKGRSRSAEFYRMLLMILEYGSVPHEIEPVLYQDGWGTRTGWAHAFEAVRGGQAGHALPQALHFRTREGREVFARRVQHPGTAPTGMVRITEMAAARWIADLMIELRNEYVRQYGGL